MPIADASALHRLSLLGQAQLKQGDLRADLPDAAPSYLLALLGVRADWVTREELAALLWPQASLQDGQRNLRVNLNRLRVRLDTWGAAAGLATERRRVRWLPGSDVSQARAAAVAGDWQSACAALAGASRAQFASGLSFRGFPVLAEWADGERRALRALAREAVLRCAAGAAPAAAALLLARQLEAEPGDEDLMQARLHALAALGRHEELKREFTAFDARSRADLGLPASAALALLAARLGPAGSGAAGAAAQDESLIGREDDLAHAQAALAGHRWVTLVGLGGVGKTRLARALVQAEQNAPQAQSSVVRASLWLALQDVLSVAELAHRVPAGLGLPAAPSREPEALAARLLAERVQLLVLDNAEPLLGQRAELHRLLSLWLQAAPALRLLVTSREPLAHPLERVLTLRALTLPSLTPTPAGEAAAMPRTGAKDEQALAAADDEMLAAPAVRLLLAQAQRAQPGFDGRSHRTTLALIARQVGGLPLALHIAAQWLRVLSPADVLAALRRQVAGLDGEDAGVAATLWSSWRLLERPAQQALAALSVFVSPFSADDAVQAGAAALPQLARLLDLGLVETWPAGEPQAPSRLQLHPLVRQFAAERLASKPADARTAHGQHADSVRRRLASFRNWRQVDQRQALQTMAVLLPEALSAWHWTLAQGHSDFVTDTAPVLCNYFERLGRWAEGVALYAQAESGLDADLPGEQAALAALARCRALLLYRDGRFDVAEALAQRALAWARALGHAEGVKANLNTLALARWMLGRLDEALLAASEARALAAADGDHAGEAVFCGTVALLQKKRGDYAEAEASWRRALAVHREVGNWASACVTLGNLGNLLRVLGRAEEAVVLLDESLRLCDAYGFAASRPFSLINLAQAHLAAGRLEAAEPLASQALAEARRVGERMLEAGTLLVLAELALRAGRLGLAAQHLAPALRAARAIGDPANLLEALSGYARWCLAQARRPGRSAAAAQALATVLAHPALHAELRDELQRSPLAALPAVPAADLLALVETASAELTRAAQASADDTAPTVPGPPATA